MSDTERKVNKMRKRRPQNNPGLVMMREGGQLSGTRFSEAQTVQSTLRLPRL